MEIFSQPSAVMFRNGIVVLRLTPASEFLILGQFYTIKSSRQVDSDMMENHWRI